jgi:hypothetical protein
MAAGNSRDEKRGTDRADWMDPKRWAVVSMRGIHTVVDTTIRAGNRTGPAGTAAPHPFVSGGTSGTTGRG